MAFLRLLRSEKYSWIARCKNALFRNQAIFHLKFFSFPQTWKLISANKQLAGAGVGGGSLKLQYL